MMNFKFLAIIIPLLVCTACKKNTLDEAPEITFVSITPTNPVALQEAIKITINYLDNNGDLGENTPGVENLFVKDLRNAITYGFRIQQLSPKTGIRIQGKLTIDIGSGFLISNPQEEQVVYEVYVLDRAGNRSNTIKTQSITIHKDE